MACGCLRSNKVAPAPHVPGSEWAHYKYRGMGAKHTKGLHHPQALPFEEVCPEKENELIRKAYKSTSDKLGEGGFAKVMLGVHKETKEKVAIKITSDKNKNARREVELLVFIGTHERIAGLIDCYMFKKKIYMIFNYYDKGDLMDLMLEIERFDEDTASTVARGIVEAVAFCHSKNVAHRDVKGENVLYRGSPDHNTLQIKLADFGAATYFESPRQLFSEKIGSSCYVAPEILKEKYFPPKADVWSIGATIFCILNGEPPFHGPFTDLTMHRVLTTPLEIPHTISLHASTCAQHFILTCMTRKVYDRPATEDLLKHAWLQQRAKGVEPPDMELREPEDPAKIEDQHIYSHPSLL